MKTLVLEGLKKREFKSAVESIQKGGLMLIMVLRFVTEQSW